MNHPVIFSARTQQGGAAAVELALCMSLILVPLLFWITLLGKFLWQYTAAQKSVHHAALYMAGARLSEIRSGGSGNLALDIIAKETSDFDQDTSMTPSVSCGYKFGGTSMIIWTPCSSSLTPVSVQAAIELKITHPFFSLLSSHAGSGKRVDLWAYSQVTYVGN
jgi:cytochrome c biogenesis protein CcdA